MYMETKRLTTRIGKLLSGTRKPDEGFATIFVYEPKDYLEKQHGKIYFVIEITSGSKSTSSVGEVIINSIKDEYYSDLNRSVILSFESALRKVNEELSDFASAGETDWIGKLNVACVILAEDKLHLSKVGTTEAYIVRGEKITHISEGLSVEEEKEKGNHPLKTFSTITSGSVQEEDKIIVSSSELFYHISLAGIKKIVSENTPSDSISKLKDLLKNEEGIGSIGFLIIENLTEDALSNTNEHTTDEIWIEESKPSKSFLAILSSILISIATFFKSSFQIIKSKVIPATISFGKKIKTKIVKTKEEPLENFDDEKDMKEQKEYLTQTDKEPIETDKKEKQPKNNETFINFVINYFKNFSFEKFFKDVQRVFGNIKNAIKEKSKSIYFKLFAVFAILFVISIFFLVRNNNIEKNNNTAKLKLDSAIEKENKAEFAIITGARKEARNLLDESKIMTEDLTKTKYSKEAHDLLAKINLAYQRVDGITKTNTVLIQEIEQNINPNAFTILNNNIYYIDSKNNQLISFDIDAKKQKKYDFPTPQKPFSKIIAIPKNNTILMYSDEPEIFEFNEKNGKISEATSKNGFNKAFDLANYQLNLYILSKEDNQIYRYTKSASGFSSASNFITDKSINIKDAVSLTIPSNTGFVYVLQKNGTIIKLTKSKKQDFTIKDMPFSFKNPVKIQSNNDGTKLYVLDKELGIINIDANGKYTETFKFKDIKNIKDFYIDNKTGTIYVLSGNKILSLEK
ncbi:hypothetical protein COU50_00370 [bacterium CG10_big_fil_rev_8_21_14_0_10_33_18]|nr:MAG: hypothetical protein COU50_00370 [bacterium CG10_big_fil_rev_8_21_14_0_10_33_18]PJA71895.1 MAG: hypothetical protein CO152_04250 [bacterium CG_4_9_14_3_um_filter_33_26]